MPTAYATATNISLSVTWPAQLASNSGSGTVHIWLLNKYTQSGTSLTGVSQTCNLSLPDVTLTTLGVLGTGCSGSSCPNKVQVQIPASTWTNVSKTFPVTGKQNGWGPASQFTLDPTVALYGVTLPAGGDPRTFMWPSTSWTFPTGTMFPSEDGSGNPGLTAAPLNGNGYVYPPTSASGPPADQVYIASRNEIATSGTWTSCTDASGTAMVSLFDNHVLGCRISTTGMPCTKGPPMGLSDTQANFLDANRTVYVAGTATFVLKLLPTSATCADALSAVP